MKKTIDYIKNEASQKYSGLKFDVSYALNKWSNELEKFGGFSFTSKDGRGTGTRAGDVNPGKDIDIDPIISAFNGMGLDGSKVKRPENLIEGLEMFKEVKSASEFTRDLMGSSNETSPKAQNTDSKISTFDKAKRSQTRQLKKHGYMIKVLNGDTSIYTIQYFTEKSIIRTDTVKP